MRQTGAASLALALTVACAPATAQEEEPGGYGHTAIEDELAGAAFVVAANMVANPAPELVVSAFGHLGFGPDGPILPPAGTVTLYKNAQPGFAPNGQLARWNAFPIVTEEDGITFPNRPELVDVNEDGLLDVIVPGGYFFDSLNGNARGTLTWWEAVPAGKGWVQREWVRHDLITESFFSYHSAVLEDFDGDGIADIMTVAEDAGDPGFPFDDFLEVQLLLGLGDAQFGEPITVARGGGGLIEAYDVDDDGDMDLVSPQFFGFAGGQPFVPEEQRTADHASFVWFENLGNAIFAKHAIGIAQGPGFAIVPVDNFRGDGVTRWIATNHTNPNVEFAPFSLYPEPAVYEFTPGEDPKALWSVNQLSAPDAFPVTGGPGQAAPGYVSAGHLNEDGRLDLAVSGDGSRAVYWMEQHEDGNFTTHMLAGSEGHGQSGGPVIMDLNRSGENEIVFGSFDLDMVSIWHLGTASPPRRGHSD